MDIIHNSALTYDQILLQQRHILDQILLWVVDMSSIDHSIAMNRHLVDDVDNDKVFQDLDKLP